MLPIDTDRRTICKPILVSLGHMYGTTTVDLGEVFRAAFKAQADAIIVAHNHPSGDPTPSKADLQLTSALQSTARLLGIKFLDHLILGSPDCEDGRGYVSVVEKNYGGQFSIDSGGGGAGRKKLKNLCLPPLRGRSGI